jgi:GntR family transcriptional regulator
MFFKINPSNGTPVYEQVVNQVVAAIANGDLRAGEMIPSVRQLSLQLAINPNTVSRAYRQLQESGFVTAIRGSGLKVQDGAKKKCLSERNKTLKRQLKEFVSRARQTQLTDDEIRKLLEQILKTGKRS